jgi:hypothetical protein
MPSSLSHPSNSYLNSRFGPEHIHKKKMFCFLLKDEQHDKQEYGKHETCYKLASHGCNVFESI